MSRWFEVGTFCLQFFEKRDPYSEGIDEQPYHGTKALKYALRKLEANKRYECITEEKKETDKTDGISEKTQRETPKQEQKLEECEAKNPKINNQHEGKSKENEEKETKVPQILSSNEETIGNNLSEINNAEKSIRRKFNACIDTYEKWKSVFSDAKDAKGKILNDTSFLIRDIQKLKKKLEALSRDIKKVNSDKKEIFEKAFGMIQKNVDKLLADIDQYRKERKK
ncbi:MAG: hypothetical protein IJ793_04110 [Opitutales bacterium]|nr:hypothetical protein [Opitutales bacterium]